MIKKLHTKQLMKLLNNTRGYWSDDKAEIYVDGHRFEFTREELKVELATREHIPNKKENKKKRQEMAKKKR